MDTQPLTAPERVSAGHPANSGRSRAHQLRNPGASFEVAGRDRGFSRSKRRVIAAASVAEYQTRMRQAAAWETSKSGTPIELWYAHIEMDELFKQLKPETTKKQRAKATKNLANPDVRGGQ